MRLFFFQYIDPYHHIIPCSLLSARGPSEKPDGQLTEIRRLYIKSTIPAGIGTGILTWIFLSLFELLIDKKPMNETLFSTFNLIFLVAISLVETRVYYRKFVKNEKKSS